MVQYSILSSYCINGRNMNFRAFILFSTTFWHPFTLFNEQECCCFTNALSIVCLVCRFTHTKKTKSHKELEFFSSWTTLTFSEKLLEEEFSYIDSGNQQRKGTAFRRLTSKEGEQNNVLSHVRNRKSITSTNDTLMNRISLQRANFLKAYPARRIINSGVMFYLTSDVSVHL